MHDAVGRHDVLDDDLRRVTDEDLVVGAAAQVQQAAEQVERAHAPLDHGRADDVRQHVVLHQVLKRELRARLRRESEREHLEVRRQNIEW